MVASRALTTGLGLLSIAIADFRARRGMEASEPFFWLGLLIIVVPIGLTLWSPRPTRRDRIGLVLLLGLSLQFVRVLYNSGNLAFYDEFAHLRTAIDITVSGHLFLPNPLQPISAYYPGLEALTAVFADLSGLSLDQAGLVIIGIGRMVLVLALFMLFERASQSHRAAGAAVLLYAANPSFLFFDAQFSYESLALPFAVVAAALLAVRTPSRAGSGLGRALLVGIAITATVVTHHVTSFALVAFLVAWAAFDRLHRRPAARRITPTAAAVFAAAAATTWLLLIAPLTISYIAPHVVGGIEQVLQLIMGESTGRRLFVDQAGIQAPVWERLVGYVAVFLILGALPVALRTIRRSYGRSPIAITSGLVALGYPTSLALRLTDAGAETAGRLSAFVFIGVAFAIAVWGAGVTAVRQTIAAIDSAVAAEAQRLREPATAAWTNTRGQRVDPVTGRFISKAALNQLSDATSPTAPTRPTTIPRTVGAIDGVARFRAAVSSWTPTLLAVASTAVFAGGVIVGFAPWARLPFPYRPAADSRSVEPEGLSAAGWTAAELGPHHVFLTDRTNRQLLGSYGYQDPTLTTAAADLLLSPTLDRAGLQFIASERIEYVLADRRLSLAVPLAAGGYVVGSELGGRPITSPLDPAAFTKFDTLPEASRVFDSGDIQVFDLKSVW